MCSCTTKYLLKMILFNLLIVIGVVLILLGGYYYKSIQPMIIGWSCIIIAIIFMISCMNYHINEERGREEEETYESDITIVL